MFQESNLTALEDALTALAVDLYGASLTPEHIKALICGQMAAIILGLGGGAAAAGAISEQDVDTITVLATTAIAKTTTN